MLSYAQGREMLGMVYVFEFSIIEVEGNRIILQTIKQRIETKDLARAHGESMMHNVLFKDQKANVCVIKDQNGTMLCEMRANA
jgi:hypothetical protein